ncbi:MAG: cytochrome C oxidase subunit IV family protein [Myxococcota bacterium]
MSTTTHSAEHGHGHGDHVSHVISAKTLLLVWGLLIVLTVVTVVTATQPMFNFGAYTNLVIAMIIATVKASAVCLFFMHLLYDRKFNLMIFMGSLLFVLLFVSFAMLDTAQYQQAIQSRVEAQAQ